jgi:hypothetical protein
VVQLAWGFSLVQSGDFGWTAYAPLTTTTFSPFPTTSPLTAISLICVGVVFFVGRAGYRAGRRSGGTPSIRRNLILAIGVAILVGVMWSALLTPGSSSETLVGTPESGGSQLFVAVNSPAVIFNDLVGALIFSAAFGAIAWWAGEQIGRRRERRTNRPSPA